MSVHCVSLVRKSLFISIKDTFKMLNYDYSASGCIFRCILMNYGFK